VAVLLAYLGCEARWVSREYVTALLWPDTNERKARQSLRALLYKCKKLDWAELEVTDTHVRWSVVSDVSQFQDACSNADWATAVDIYQGTFLKPHRASVSAPFDNWLEQTRAELHANWRDAALPVARDLNQQGEVAKSVCLLEAVFAEDDLAEDVLQVYMQSLALSGQSAKALRVFECFHTKLATDLGMSPLADTLELAETIRQGKWQPQFQDNSPAVVTQRVTEHTPVPNAPQHAEGQPGGPSPSGQLLANTVVPFARQLAPLPQPQTAFIGRTLDLLELANRLTDTRLITLLGPGGVGKSRLALALLEQQQHHYHDGVVFVALATVQTAADVPDAIASSLQLPLSGSKPVLEDVCDYLADKRMLVVLDNLEHLLTARELILQLLARTPKCRFVTTSRVLLELPGECVYDVVGLSLPKLTTSQTYPKDHLETRPEDYLETHLDAYDAINMFVRQARQVRSDFALHASDRQALIELCQLLEGIPLALELAASWVRLYTLPELVSALKQDMDLLEADGHQVSERHRSMRQVFLSSWQQLTVEEKRVLAALSVFCGDFELIAACIVTGASARTLLRLVNRSLLRRTPLGRFSMLEVIRQYAAEQLIDGDSALVARAHCEYYLAFMRDKNFRTNAPKVPLESVDANFDNVRSAWRYALNLATNATLDLNEFVKASHQINFYLDLRGRFREGIALFQEGIDVFDTHVTSTHTSVQTLDDAILDDATLGALLLNQALFYWWINDLDRTAELATRALTLLAGSDNYTDQIAAHYALSDYAEYYGNSERAKAHLNCAGELVEAHGSLLEQRAYIKECAILEHTLGNFEAAQLHYARALQSYQASSDQVGIAEMLHHWGTLKLEQADARGAKDLLEQSQVLINSYGDEAYSHICQADLGACALALGELEQAETHYLDAIKLARQNSSLIGPPKYAADYALVKLAQGDTEAATTLLQQSLQTAWQLQDTSVLLHSLLGWAEYWLGRDNTLAHALISCVLQHRASPARIKRRAQKLLARVGVPVDDQVILSDLECLAPHVTHLVALNAS
jgi:predicted ATPase/DNA-binding SARP family transcriptional activator